MSKYKSRPGYWVVGFCTQFRHPATGKIVKAKPGTKFPIYRRIGENNPKK